MKDNLSDLQCMCCGFSVWRMIPFVKEYSYMRCEVCGYFIHEPVSVEQKKILFNQEQQKFYDDQSMLLSPIMKYLESESVSMRLRLVNQFLGKYSKLLEVGPGSGSVISRFLKEGYLIDAAEESQALAKNIQNEFGKFGVNVFAGTFESQDFGSEIYDGYMSFHVLEHVVDVEQHLKKAKDIVKPNGFAFIATPNTDSWEHNFPWRLSPNYDSAHFQLFSEKALSLCIERAGWKVIQINTPEYTTGWVRVITKLLRRIKKRENKDIGGEYAASFKNNEKLFVFILGLIRRITSPLRYIQGQFGKGNELFIVAQKS
jgi:2-polyprenyl-3-methyl-5-hydroxy-6-metoxy-1,4-benzoquinol methylase